MFIALEINETPIAYAADDMYCTQYAKEAVAQNQKNLTRRCGFTGGRWQSDYNKHYSWCIKVAGTVAQSETKARQNSLSGCKPKDLRAKEFNVRPLTPAIVGKLQTKESACKNYAKAAVALNQENLKQGCGLTGSQWHSNYNNHYNWCMLGKNLKYTGKETRAKQFALKECSKKNACDQYAKDAVAQNQENLKQGCGFKDGQWHSNYNNHYNWCLKSTGDSAQSESKARQGDLDLKCYSKAGDLEAYDWCYNLNESKGEITFYPVIRNVGTSAWKSTKEGDYYIGVQVGSISSEKKYKILAFPYWSINPGEVKKLHGGITRPFSTTNVYSYMGSCVLTHPDDINPANNGLMDYEGIKYSPIVAGKEFLSGGSMLKKKCKSIYAKDTFTEDNDTQFVAYVSDEEGRFTGYVSSFIDEFKNTWTNTQYYWGECRFLGPDDDDHDDHLNFADSADLAYIAGHGSPSAIKIHSGQWCDLQEMAWGSYSSKDRKGDLEYIVFHSCSVLAMDSNWRSRWAHNASTKNDNRPFSGLHMAMGFRTNHVHSGMTGDWTADEFAENLEDGYTVRYAWYEAVDDYRWTVAWTDNKPAIFYIRPHKDEILLGHTRKDYHYGDPEYILDAYYME